jgi:type IV secretion system protein VirB4
VRGLGQSGARQFLVKQGHRSAMCEFDLGGMDDVLTVLSGSTDNVVLLDELRAQVGDDPKLWLPLMNLRVRARKGQRR